MSLPSGLAVSQGPAQPNQESQAAAGAVFLCGAMSFLDLYCTQPLLPLLAQRFHASETSASWTVSAATLGVAITAVLLALFGERLDRKRTIVGSIFALAAVTALAATAPSLSALSEWRLVQGLLTPCIFIVTIAYVTEEWPARRVPRVMSIYVAGTVFGGFSGRVLGGEITEHDSWRAMFLVMAIIGACGGALAQRILKPSSKRGPRHGGSRLSPFLGNLRNPRLLATFAVGFCILFMQVSLFNYIAFYLAGAPFRLSPAELSWVFAVYLVGLVATLLAGTALAHIGLFKGILGAIALCFAGVALTLVPSLAVIGIGLSAASSGVFISQTCTNSFLRDAAPAGSRVSAAGMYTCIYYSGGTVGGLLPALAWREAGWPGCVAMICCFLVAAGTIAFFGWHPRPAPLRHQTRPEYN